MAKVRATIVVADGEDVPPDEYHWVVDWLIRWEKGVRIAGYENDDLTHVWDVEGIKSAIDEVPAAMLRQSAWTAASGGGLKHRKSAGKMTFSVSKAKRLRNRARRVDGDLDR